MIFLEESHILLFLVQFLIVLLFARVGGELFRAMRQPLVTGEILAGILLGPTVLGRFFPEIHGAIFPAEAVQASMLETVSWLGVLFLLLESGLEIDFSIAWRQRSSALVIAISDIVIPMIIAFIPSLFMPARYLTGDEERWIFALFMAAVMTISAMPVAAKAMHDLNVLKSEMGFLIMSALAVNDLIGWVIFTVVLTLFSSAAPDILSLGLTVGFTISFAALALWLGPRLSTRLVSGMHRRGLPEPSSSLTLICLMGLLFGAITQQIGIHALFGFFIAGVVIGEAKPLSEESRTIISQVVYSVFVPVFFAGIGLKIDFLESFDVLLALFVSLIGIAGRFFGAWIGVSLARSFTGDRQAIAVAHTPGGVMEIVVALLALNTGLITSEIFVAIVFAALFSSTLMGPWMSRAIRRRPPAVIRYAHASIVIPGATEASRDELIAAMAKLAARQGGVEFDHLFKPVIEREREYSTALGNEIAIPHARVEHLDNPLIAYARSPIGVDWNSPDGKPVHYIFLIVVPRASESEQVRILASIARMMSHGENRLFFETASEPQHIAEEINRRLSSEMLALK